MDRPITERETQRMLDTVLAMNTAGSYAAKMDALFGGLDHLLRFDTAVSFVGNDRSERRWLSSPHWYKVPAAQSVAPPVLAERYMAMQEMDPSNWMFHAERSTVFRGTDSLDDSIRTTTRLYRDVVVPMGIHYTIEAVMVRAGKLVGTFAMGRSKDKGNFDEHDLKIVRMIEPHVALSMSGLRPNSAKGPDVESLASRFGLTEREASVASLVVQGCTNIQIARQLGLSESSVKRHVGNVMRKVGAGNRASLVGTILLA